MGQRLVLTIYQPHGCVNGMVKYLATAYYHWDGFTLQALEDVKACYEWWKENHKEDGNLLHEAIHMLEATNAGITPEAEKALGDDAKLFNKAVHRNAGLIDITERGIAESFKWTEGEAYFNIETGEITFDVFNYFAEEDLESNDYTKRDIEQALPISFSKESSEDITSFSGKNIQEVIDYLEKNEANLFKDPSDGLDSYLSCIY